MPVYLDNGLQSTTHKIRSTSGNYTTSNWKDAVRDWYFTRWGSIHAVEPFLFLDKLMIVYFDEVGKDGCAGFLIEHKNRVRE